VSWDNSTEFNCALIAGFEGDFARSLTLFEVLAVKYPLDDDVIYELAMTHFMLGMNEEGCAHLKLILARNPNHEKARQQAVYC
jgi:hypothetical protein